ncbi:hypothetical protein H2248_011019 [Termitomyces sp. 'cryptogamus']|nr:hypothetical protein H2248_011019 [Termitomyces sp. 'cryptogamus']
MHKLVMLVKCKGSFYHDDKSLAPLTNDQINEIKDAMEEWMQKEAQVHEIIYSTVDQSAFHQVKGEPTATDIWKKLMSIHGSKGAMYGTDLLAQLQNTCFVKNGEIDMHTHLSNMVVIKEHLTEIGCPFYIHTSMSLAPTYKPLFTTLATSACTSGKSVSSQDLIWHLNEEANSTAIKSNINCQHKVMIVAHTKACGDPRDTKEKGKSKSKNKDKDK